MIVLNFDISRDDVRVLLVRPHLTGRFLSQFPNATNTEIIINTAGSGLVDGWMEDDERI